MQKKHTLFVLFTFFCLILNARSSYQEEKILNFHSDIRIDSTGRVLVTENIKLYAAGESIKRGIVRSIPVYRKNIHGKQEKINIEVLSVSRDGNNENYFTEKNGDQLEIFIGNEDYILPPNEYIYQITYESYGHVGFFDNFDEIYWNVTGNDWIFL